MDGLQTLIIMDFFEWPCITYMILDTVEKIIILSTEAVTSWPRWGLDLNCYQAQRSRPHQIIG